MKDQEPDDLVSIPRGMLDYCLDVVLLVLCLFVAIPVLAMLTFAVLWLITGD